MAKSRRPVRVVRSKHLRKFWYCSAERTGGSERRGQAVGRGTACAHDCRSRLLKWRKRNKLRKAVVNTLNEDGFNSCALRST